MLTMSVEVSVWIGWLFVLSFTHCQFHMVCGEEVKKSGNRSTDLTE